MRCNNCGWTNNPSGAARCEKCNVPLAGSMAADEYTDRNVTSAQNRPLNNQVLNGTLRTGASGLPYVDAPEEVSSKFVDNNANNHSSECAKCGYPLTFGLNTCPNCQTNQMKNNEDEKPSNPKKSSTSGTIDPFSAGFNFGNSCSFTPLNEPDRKIMFDNSTILNRANIDPNNNTITSKEQANLECRDGEWYITDLSSQETTFIRKKGEVVLHDGDIILMGNKRFVFNKK